LIETLSEARSKTRTSLAKRKSALGPKLPSRMIAMALDHTGAPLECVPSFAEGPRGERWGNSRSRSGRPGATMSAFGTQRTLADHQVQFSSRASGDTATASDRMPRSVPDHRRRKYSRQRLPPGGTSDAGPSPAVKLTFDLDHRWGLATTDTVINESIKWTFTHPKTVAPTSVDT
jgi:hypothetical protein